MMDEEKEIKDSDLPEGFQEVSAEEPDVIDVPHDDVDPVAEDPLSPFEITDKKEEEDVGVYGDDRQFEEELFQNSDYEM